MYYDGGPRKPRPTAYQPTPTSLANIGAVCADANLIIFLLLEVVWWKTNGNPNQLPISQYLQILRIIGDFCADANNQKLIISGSH